VLVVNEQGDKTGHANKKPINLAPLDWTPFFDNNFLERFLDCNNWKHFSVISNSKVFYRAKHIFLKHQEPC
jgi:hypothetical protein